MPNNPNAVANLKPFRAGQSGNPTGRPKGAVGRASLIRKWLAVLEKFRNPITGQMEKLSQEDIITLAMINEARQGNTAAYRALLDSAHGRVTQALDLNE